MALPDFPDYNKWGFSLVALNNDVYVTGRCWAGGQRRPRDWGPLSEQKLTSGPDLFL